MAGNGTNGEHKHSYVTNAELKDKLDKLRWEVRFLILAAFIGGQIIPNIQLNQPVQTGLAAMERILS